MALISLKPDSIAALQSSESSEQTNNYFISYNGLTGHAEDPSIHRRDKQLSSRRAFSGKSFIITMHKRKTMDTRHKLDIHNLRLRPNNYYSGQSSVHYLSDVMLGWSNNSDTAIYKIPSILDINLKTYLISFQHVAIRAILKNFL